jgi:hypothetical protein
MAGKQLKVMIAGAPAAGKGTQCEKIVDKVRLCVSYRVLVLLSLLAVKFLTRGWCSECRAALRYAAVQAGPRIGGRPPSSRGGGGDSGWQEGAG